MITLTRVTRAEAAPWVEAHHYTGTITRCGARALYCYLATGDEAYGVVVYGLSNNRNTDRFTGGQTLELTRVALAPRDKDKWPTSMIVAASMRQVVSDSGVMRYISYADDRQGHAGIIYQATNWIRAGVSKSKDCIVNGTVVAKRTATSVKGAPVTYAPAGIRHRYLWSPDRKIMKAWRARFA